MIFAFHHDEGKVLTAKRALRTVQEMFSDVSVLADMGITSLENKISAATIETELQTNHQIALVIDLLKALLIKPIRAMEEQHKQNVDYIKFQKIASEAETKEAAKAVARAVESLPAVGSEQIQEIIRKEVAAALKNEKEGPSPGASSKKKITRATQQTKKPKDNKGRKRQRTDKQDNGFNAGANKRDKRRSRKQLQKKKTTGQKKPPPFK